MERKEKKKRKDYKGRQESRSTPSFPIDLTSEILLRLPEKSVARFRCVSKLWSSITTDPYFIDLFETRSPRPSLLLCVRKDDNMFVSSIPQHTQETLHKSSNKSFSSSQPKSSYHMKFPEDDDGFRPTESVHGLICFQESLKPVVWNPSKKEFLTLPKPRKSWIDITVFLGYDPTEGKHKVMCIPCNRTSDVCRVLTLGSPQESWRTVKTNQKHRSSFNTTGRCIKGVIYYKAYIYHTRLWVIMSFDVRSEKFHMIPFPLEARKNLLLNYEGRLSFVDDTNPRRLLILEDAEKNKWSKHEFLSHLSRDVITERSLHLKGFTNAGELVYVASLFNNSSYILFCDPARNSFRRFEFKGISKDESWLNNEGEGLFMSPLHIFLNHTESQISL
ncbi:putative F-box protein At1g47790 [Raphanus sativus]|uniref:F-box protein At1g47790 n=1 Tax=Raphanus sativus TaxID=3726 RepID=A0A6J0KR80_RAPSA|nr:putative F-box protein At1g47790 [Raphanus sativus]